MCELVTGEVRPLSAAEMSLWLQYRQRYGFSTDRIEWAAANGASAICHAWGAKTKAADIVPKFYGRRGTKKKLVHQLANLWGAEVTFIPNDPSRKQLKGADALAELDRASGKPEDGSGDYKRGSARTLDGGKRPEKPPSTTLAGD